MRCVDLDKGKEWRDGEDTRIERKKRCGGKDGRQGQTARGCGSRGLYEYAPGNTNANGAAVLHARHPLLPTQARKWNLGLIREMTNITATCPNHILYLLTILRCKNGIEYKHLSTLHPERRHCSP